MQKTKRMQLRIEALIQTAIQVIDVLLRGKQEDGGGCGRIKANDT